MDIAKLITEWIRVCPKCNKTLYYKSNQTKKAAINKNTLCYGCAFSNRPKMAAEEARQSIRKAQRKYLLKLKQFVWNYLKQHPCVDCEESNILFLEFDHITEKKEWVSWLLRRHASIEEIRTEIRKCEVRCIVCHRIRTKRQYPPPNINNRRGRSRFRLQKYVRDYLAAHSCVDCNETNTDILEFDHVRGKKYKAVSELVGWAYGIGRIREEIDKCDVVCVKCHRMRTAIRGRWKILNFLD